MSWYQAKGLVEDYIDQFQELIDVVEYDDDKTIVSSPARGSTQSSKTRWHSLEITPQTSMIWRVGMRLHRRLLGTGKQMRSPAEALPDQADLQS